jgi:hypothetical protein
MQLQHLPHSIAYSLSPFPTHAAFLPAALSITQHFRLPLPSAPTFSPTSFTCCERQKRPRQGTTEIYYSLTSFRKEITAQRLSHCRGRVRGEQSGVMWGVCVGVWGHPSKSKSPVSPCRPTRQSVIKLRTPGRHWPRPCRAVNISVENISLPCFVLPFPVLRTLRVITEGISQKKAISIFLWDVLCGRVSVSNSVELL